MTRRTRPVTVSDKIYTVLLSLALALTITVSCAVLADTDEKIQPVFEVSPKRCVTLRQGQPCFVKLRFEWQSTEIVRVCVYGLENEKLKCWSAASGGSVVMPQTLPGSTEYILRDDAGVEMNRVSVSVSWVYRKKRSKRRWRLF